MTAIPNQRNNWSQDIYVLIPAYKAASHLTQLLPALLEIIPARQICLVDDASVDNTGELCAQYGIDYLLQNRNQGKGAALKRGFAYLLQKNAQWILTMDADGQHAIADIPELLKTAILYPQTGMIIGARNISPEYMPLARVFSNTVTSKILSLMCRCKILDSQCGYRMYSERLLRKVRIEYSRFEMESEIILKACFFHFSIRFVPIQTLYCNSTSHIAHIKDMARWVRAVTRVWLAFQIKKIWPGRKR